MQRVVRSAYQTKDIGKLSEGQSRFTILSSLTDDNDNTEDVEGHKDRLRDILVPQLVGKKGVEITKVALDKGGGNKGQHSQKSQKGKKVLGGTHCLTSEGTSDPQEGRPGPLKNLDNNQLRNRRPSSNKMREHISHFKDGPNFKLTTSPIESNLVDLMVHRGEIQMEVDPGPQRIGPSRDNDIGLMVDDILKESSAARPVNILMISGVLVWNCRGAGSKGTLLHLKQNLEMYKPIIVAILEPRIHSSKVIFSMSTTYLINMVAVEADGFVRDLWVFWNKGIVHLEDISMHDQMINAMVTESNGAKWIMSVVYTLPYPNVRDELWKYIRCMGGYIHIPWVLIDDFNQIVEARDKQRGRAFNPAMAASLIETIEFCQLMDVGFQGTHYTWTNNRKGSAKIRERINQAWCNVEWSLYFQGAMVHHLPRVNSDHHPLLLEIHSRDFNKGFKGFRFLEGWFQHPEYAHMVE